MAVSRFMERAATRDYSKDWVIPGTFPWMVQQARPPIGERAYNVLENYNRCVRGEKPYWMPAYGFETNTVWPDTIEEHPVPEVDGYDWWGVYWTMVEDAGGMITKTGTRVISDFANWKEEVEWPDISVVDFETDGKKLQARLDPDRPHIYECTEGLFERLHEMMPFDETLLAFYTEPELLEEFFQKMADYKIETCQKVFQYYGRIDGVLYHDDWGTQRAGFFSNEMFREQLMPATSRFIRFVKDSGRFVELHSCGCNIQYIPEMAEMGIDMWTPQDNANDKDVCFENYNDILTFAFPCSLQGCKDDADVRARVDEFVEKYGKNGRWMASFRSGTREQQAVARDELYTFSLNYYNKLYGRR